MTIRKPQNGRAVSMTQGLMTGLAVSFTITLAATTILAKVIDKEILPWQNIGYAIIPILLLGSFAGAYTACQKIKRQKLGVSMLSGALYWIGLMAITALFYGGKYESVAVTAALIMAGCFSAFLLTAPKTTPAKHRKHKLRNR